MSPRDCICSWLVALHINNRGFTVDSISSIHALMHANTGGQKYAHILVSPAPKKCERIFALSGV